MSVGSNRCCLAPPSNKPPRACFEPSLSPPSMLPPASACAAPSGQSASEGGCQAESVTGAPLVGVSTAVGAAAIWLSAAAERASWTVRGPLGRGGRGGPRPCAPAFKMALGGTRLVGGTRRSALRARTGGCSNLCDCCCCLVELGLDRPDPITRGLLPRTCGLLLLARGLLLRTRGLLLRRCGLLLRRSCLGF